MTDFPHLLEPGQIGRVSLRNRVVMPPMTTGYPYPDGNVSERTKAYYGARAAGGVGLIIVEACLIHPLGKSFDHQISIYADSFIPGLRQLTEVVHAHEAKIFVQLHHGGMAARADLIGQIPLAPSAVALPGRPAPQELSREQIQEIIEAQGQAARRAKEAGFDGVELHGAHGYLINQFLSPFANQRHDEFGGTPERRLRFALECLRRCRELVGPDYPIIIRLSVDEFHPQGLDLAQSQVIAQALETAGIDGIHVSAGAGWSESTRDPRMPLATGTGEGVFLHLAEGIKKVVRVPIIGVGQVYSPEVAEAALERGQADFMAMGRALLADQALANKVAAGRRDQVIPCVNCDACQLRPGRPGISCPVNPETGREFQLRLEKTAAPKEVLVLGGGLAGLEAARVAAVRGHRVSVRCSEDELGGLWGQRVRAPGQEVLARAVGYYTAQMKELGIKVTTAQVLDRQQLDASGAVVVVASAGEASPPSFPISGAEAIPALDVISGKRIPGGRVLAVGSGVLLAETALCLALAGNQVTLIEKGNRVAPDAHPRLSLRLRLALEEKGAQVFLGARVLEVTAGRAVVDGEGGRHEVEFDALVYADGFVAAEGLVEALRRQGNRAYLAGDAYEAYELGALTGAATELARQL